MEKKEWTLADCMQDFIDLLKGAAETAEGIDELYDFYEDTMLHCMVPTMIENWDLKDENFDLEVK